MLSNQFDFLPLTYSRLVSTPVVTTIHGFSSDAILPVFRAYDDIADYVAISDADRHPGPDLRRDDPSRHRPRPLHVPRPPGGPPALPRPHPSRQGPHRAVEVARRAGLPLVIAGIVQDREYFDTLVRPHLDKAGVT